MKNIEQLSSEIAEDVFSISKEDLLYSLQEELVDKNTLLNEIRIRTIAFINKLEQYGNEQLFSKKFYTIQQELNFLEFQKEQIYNDFFIIQDLMNKYIGQRIVMTYVHVDENGRREIRIADNDTAHLGITEGTLWNGRIYHKLSYIVESHYSLLKNSQSNKDNENLQQTAMEVEYRYNTYKKRVMWYTDTWHGVRFRNKGPINEAYVHFYVHEIALNRSMEENIETFIMHKRYGAFAADATKGYMIGDVSYKGIQFAVKGEFGSPQGVKDVINQLKILVNNNFSSTAIKNFIKRYTEDELKTKYTPQIKMMTKQSLSGVLRYYKDLEQRVNIQI